VGQGGHVADRVARGEIRLFRFAPPDKQRPVVVLTRDSIIDRLARVTVAPVSSTIRGVASEVALGVDDGLKLPCAVNLHNIVTVPKTGLGRRVAQLDERRLDQLRAAIAFALGCRG
jgi:mRNA interferase MazF